MQVLHCIVCFCLFLVYVFELHQDKVALTVMLCTFYSEVYGMTQLKLYPYKRYIHAAVTTSAWIIIVCVSCYCYVAGVNCSLH